MHWSECEAEAHMKWVSWVPVSFADFLFWNFMPIQFGMIWFGRVRSGPVCRSIFSWSRISRIVTLRLTSIHLMLKTTAEYGVCDKMRLEQREKRIFIQTKSTTSKNIHILRLSIVTSTTISTESQRAMSAQIMYIVYFILRCI